MHFQETRVYLVSKCERTSESMSINEGSALNWRRSGFFGSGCEVGHLEEPMDFDVSL